MMIDILPKNLRSLELDDFPGLTPHEVVLEFENQLADFFGSKYCITTDSCTHAIELCLRHFPPKKIVELTAWTYMSIPMMLEKLNIPYKLVNTKWSEYYAVTDKVIDGAVLWKQNGHLKGKMTCISFQYKKHCPIGKGGAILLDNVDDYRILYKMVYDGRDRNKLQQDDDVDSLGYHYHLTPEDAARGIKLFRFFKNLPSKKIDWSNYKDLRLYKYFQDKE